MSAPRRPPCAVTGLWPPASRPSVPPADHLGLAVRPATYTDSPIADVIWDCLAGEGDALSHDVDAEFGVDGDAPDLAAHPVEVDASWDDTDRLLERVCRGRCGALEVV